MYRPLGDARRLFDALTACAVQGIRFGTAEEMGQAVEEAERLCYAPTGRRCSVRASSSRAFAGSTAKDGSTTLSQRRSGKSPFTKQRATSVARTMRCRTLCPPKTGSERYEIALAHARSSIAALDVIGGSAGAGHLWVGVLSAEALLGRAAAAIAAGRTAYTLLLREGDELRVFQALRCARHCKARLDDAARIAGYAEGVL